MSGLLGIAAGLLLFVLPALAQAQQTSQVFSKVIKEVFANNPGDTAGTSDCVTRFKMSPNGTLHDRCATSGSDLAGGSGGQTSALTNESSPAKERLLEKSAGSWNFYVSADYEHFQKELTEFEPAYKNYIWRGAAGADYLANGVTYGAALRYIHDNGQFSGSGSFNPDFENNSYGFVLYANAAPTENSFLTASVQYLRQNMKIERSVFFDLGGSGDTAPPSFIGNTHGSPDGNQYEFQLAGGYDFHFGSVSIGPTLAMDYLYDTINDYTEQGNTGLELRYSNQQQQNLQSKLGGHASFAISTSFGVIIPQIGGEYVHEFLDPQRKTDFRFVGDFNHVNFTFENDDPDRDYFNVGAGVVLQLANGVSPFVSFRTLLGYNAETSRQATAGVRFEF